MSRGVLYMVWGTKCDQELQRSIASVERFGLKTHVVRAESRASLHQKSQMDLVSPFDETLFLDSDTLVLQELSFGFEMSMRFGLAMAIAPACSANVPDPIEGMPTDLVQYNTGVIFFTKTQTVRGLFETWRQRCDGARTVVGSQHLANNDQPPFAQAVYETGVAPFVLPLTWNYRPKFRGAPLHGPLKIWHGRQPLPSNVEEYNRTTNGFGFVEKNWRGQYRVARW